MGSAMDEAIAYLDDLIDRIRLQSVAEYSQAISDYQGIVSNSSIRSSASKEPKIETCLEASSDKAETKSRSNEANSEMEEMFGKAQIQVGYVHEVSDHPVAEKLFICQVEVSKGEMRQVVAGLRNFLPAFELQGKKVCVVVNLKPAKLAGQLSAAMILAGEASGANGQLLVKVLEPSPDASIGERIFIEGGRVNSNPAKQLSSKVWEKIVSLFRVEAGIAKFNSKPLVTSTGCVKAPDLLDGSVH